MILGHQKQWQFLKASIKLKKISHAYLFIGEQSLGKKTIAKEFIKILYCQKFKLKQNSNLKSCQNCRLCKDIQKEIHPDLMIVKPENGEIYIKQIREINQKLLLKSYLAPFKTVIIEEAHLMNQEAQNCFLKTLEEPKSKSILFLLTKYPQILLPTILSRVQKIKFQIVDIEKIKNYLINQGANEELANQLSIISQGKPGIAINFLQNKEKFETWKKKQKEILKIINYKNIYSRFQYLKTSKFFLNNPVEVLDILLNYFREILLLKNNVLISGIYKNFVSDFQSQINIYSVQKLKKILKQIEYIKFLISNTNVNSKLALEMIMIEI